MINYLPNQTLPILSCNNKLRLHIQLATPLALPSLWSLRKPMEITVPLLLRQPPEQSRQPA